jgi:hypothetical protein
MKGVKLSNTHVPYKVYTYSLQVRHIMYVNELLEFVKAEIYYLNIGEIFFVRDFFKRYEWMRDLKSDRLFLGTLFLDFMRNRINNIKLNEKTSSGQKKYGISYRLKENI